MRLKVFVVKFIGIVSDVLGLIKFKMIFILLILRETKWKTFNFFSTACRSVVSYSDWSAHC